MSFIRSIVVSSMVTGTLVAAISAGAALEFETASIRPADPATQGAQLDPARDLIAKNLTVRDLIAFAYHVASFQIAGAPAWTGDRYDVVGKAPRDESAPDSHEAMVDRTRERLRSLMAGRFSLQAHREAREQTVYLLTIARGGAKLKEITEGDQQELHNAPGRSQGLGATMAMLSAFLSNKTGRKVIDQTGLPGRYNWNLEWTLDGDADQTGPGILTAVQEQLGLKLETAKGPVDVVVIDHVDRPSQN